MMAIEHLVDAAKAHSRLTTDSQLAAHIGCTKAAVGRWRKGPGVPSDQYASALARLAGFPEKFVLECLQIARQSPREFGSWNSPLTRKMLGVIQGLKQSDRAALSLALDACAEAFEDIRLQCANVELPLLQILRSEWVLGYVYGYTETVVRSCGGGYCDSGIDAFVEMILTRLSGDRKRAEYWMTLTDVTRLADDDYSAGKKRGARERSRVADGVRPTGISDYFNNPPGRRDARDAEAITDLDSGGDGASGMRYGTTTGR